MYVSARWNFTAHWKSGTTTAWNGTIRKQRIRKKINSLNLNSNLEFPYPDIVVINIENKQLNDDISILFAINLIKG